MGIFSIARDWGFKPAIVRLATTDNLATISAVGYIASQAAQIQSINGGPFDWSPSDYILVYYSDNGGSWGFFQYAPLTQSIVPAPTGGIVPLPISDGGTGATTASGARTSLGLGTMATQNSSAVSISGGSIDGVSLGSGVTGLPVPSGLDATGTPDATTFLRGDGSWDTPAGGSVTSTQVQQSAFNHGTDTGTSTAYAVTLSPAVASYTDGLLVSFKPANTNTDTFPTLNINGVGPAGIATNAGASVSIGDLNVSYEAFCIYSSTTSQFTLLNPLVSIPLLSAMITGNGYWTGTDTGAGANDYGLNLSANVASGAAQFNPLFVVLQGANASNTGASTFSLTNGGPFTITDSQGNALVGGEILAFNTYYLFFDGVQYRLLNSSLLTPSAIQQSAYNHGLDTGAADVYVVNLNPIVGSYTDGLEVSFTPANTSLTTNPTLNINSLGPINMTSSSAAVPLTIVQISTTQICKCIFSLAAFSFLVLTPA